LATLSRLWTGLSRWVNLAALVEERSAERFLDELFLTLAPQLQDEIGALSDPDSSLESVLPQSIHCGERLSESNVGEAISSCVIHSKQ
jgi:hypothetical protein